LGVAVAITWIERIHSEGLSGVERLVLVLIEKRDIPRRVRIAAEGNRSCARCCTGGCGREQSQAVRDDRNSLLIDARDVCVVYPWNAGNHDRDIGLAGELRCDTYVRGNGRPTVAERDAAPTERCKRYKGVSL
jgi:hypothetical protein